MEKISVGILFGGVSTEHEVSRNSVSCVLREIDGEKYKVKLFEITKKNGFFIYDVSFENLDAFCGEIKKTENMLIKKKAELSRAVFRENEVDVVFPLIHGTNGEDGTLQGFLELCDIPYVGCGVLSSALCMDKDMAKAVLRSRGIPQADHLCLTCDQIQEGMDDSISKAEGMFPYPMFVKPSSSGSSVGVSKAKDREGLRKSLDLASRLDRKILVEECIGGRELECAVYGNHTHAYASEPGEVIASNEFYDYNAKYVDGKSLTIVPADIPPETGKRIQEYALEAFRALDCYGLARVDFFLPENGSPIMNEINTMPGFTDISMYPKLMARTGMAYRELIGNLIQLALEKKKRYTFTLDYEEVMRNEQ
ncbi:MAG: D-alanine--D-alanine ligase family protein [Clostridia bacterium]